MAAAPASFRQETASTGFRLNATKEATLMRRPTLWIAYVLQALLALLFLFSATMKMTGGMDDMRDLMGVVPWFWTLAGICQAIGAVSLIAGLRSARWAVAGALWLGAVMVGAVSTHIVSDITGADMLSPVALLTLLLIVAGLRWREAQVTELFGGATHGAVQARSSAH
jgi:hypothetical protein